MSYFSEKLREKLAQVYCLPKHSHKVLDPELLEDIAVTITELVRQIIPSKEELEKILNLIKMETPDFDIQPQSIIIKMFANSCRTEILKNLEQSRRLWQARCLMDIKTKLIPFFNDDLYITLFELIKKSEGNTAMIVTDDYEKIENMIVQAIHTLFGGVSGKGK